MNLHSKLARLSASLRRGDRAEGNRDSGRARRSGFGRIGGGRPCAGLPSSFRERGVRAGSVALLALAMALGLMLGPGGGEAHAQDIASGTAERVLISNLAEAQHADSTNLSTHDADIQFNTAVYGPGYIITRVDLKFTGPATSTSDLPSVVLRNRGGSLVNLTGSAIDLGGNTYAFTPDEVAHVGRGGRYGLLIEGGTLSLAQTSSDRPATGTTHQWSTLNAGYTRSHNSTGSTSALGCMGRTWHAEPPPRSGNA